MKKLNYLILIWDDKKICFEEVEGEALGESLAIRHEREKKRWSVTDVGTGFLVGAGKTRKAALEDVEQRKSVLEGFRTSKLGKEAKKRLEEYKEAKMDAKENTD